MIEGVRFKPRIACTGLKGLLDFVVGGPLAQLVEQLTLNQQVQGSRPWRLTIVSF